MAHTHSDFVREVESLYDRARPESIWDCEPAVSRLLARGSVGLWLNEELAKLLKNPTADGDWGSKEATLHRGNGWSASVALFDIPRRYIHVLPTLGMYVPLSGTLLVEQYKLPVNYRNEVFDPSVRVEPVGRPLSLDAGNILRLDTQRHAYYFQIIEPVAVLRIETAPVRALEWLFSRQTFQAWQANDAALSYTQLRVAAYVLGKIAHQSSITPLRNLASHPHHAVRWAAIQNLGRLNRSEALTKIREAVNDPHPHVRRAAQKTLEKLEGKAS